MPKARSVTNPQKSGSVTNPVKLVVFSPFCWVGLCWFVRNARGSTWLRGRAPKIKSHKSPSPSCMRTFTYLSAHLRVTPVLKLNRLVRVPSLLQNQRFMSYRWYLHRTYIPSTLHSEWVYSIVRLRAALQCRLKSLGHIIVKHRVNRPDLPPPLVPELKGTASRADT